ncbi:MAG: outer membrane beta-barrel protein [Bacteroidota bacterium]
MHRVVLFFLLLAANTGVYGQYLVGVKAGASLSKFRYFVDDSYFNSSQRIAGLEIGLVGSMEKKHFMFRHELNLIQKGGTLSPSTREPKTRLTLLELAPLAGGRADFGKFSIYGIAGPFLGYNLFGNTINNGEKEKITFRIDSDGRDSAKRLDLGYAFGMGFGLKTNAGIFALDVRTRHSIYYLVEGDAEDFALAFKNNSWGIGIVYLLNSKDVLKKKS